MKMHEAAVTAFNDFPQKACSPEQVHSEPAHAIRLVVLAGHGMLYARDACSLLVFTCVRSFSLSHTLVSSDEIFGSRCIVMGTKANGVLQAPLNCGSWKLVAFTYGGPERHRGSSVSALTAPKTTPATCKVAKRRQSQGWRPRTNRN